MTSPSITLYKALQTAFDHFNKHLFAEQLPPCLITLRSASRVYGYHHANRFISHDGQFLDELGMHPGFFALRPIEAVMSTLVHEMAHHWQHHFGTPSPSNPHNREWATKMVTLGLQPSKTGLPGGIKTGRSVSHYILPEGLFISVCQDMVAKGFSLPWLDRHAPTPLSSQIEKQETLTAQGVLVKMTPAPIMTLPAQIAGAPPLWEPKPKKAPTRFKYNCPNCRTMAWATVDASLMCGLCEMPMAKK